METALLREHCFEAEERSHDYHTSCERRAAGKGTHHVCGPAPGELVDHFCHRAIDLYHDPLARVGACRALPRPVLLFLGALIAFLGMLMYGVLHHWRWLFWGILIAFTGSVIQIPVEGLQLLG